MNDHDYLDINLKFSLSLVQLTFSSMNFQLVMSTETQYASYEMALFNSFLSTTLIRDHFEIFLFFCDKKENIFSPNFLLNSTR